MRSPPPPFLMGFPEAGGRVDPPNIDQLGLLSFGSLRRSSLSRVPDMLQLHGSGTPTAPSSVTDRRSRDSALANPDTTISTVRQALLTARICLDEIRGRLAEVFSLKSYPMLLTHTFHTFRTFRTDPDPSNARGGSLVRATYAKPIRPPPSARAHEDSSVEAPTVRAVAGKGPM